MFVKAKLFHKAGEGSGGGGGDSHNLGWYTTSSDLTTAHPTAEAGDWAIVGATDTVWVWDTDTSAWVDTDTKGQVTSVNGQTGDVTLSIPAAQVNSDWNANSGVAEILNKPTLATVATSGSYTDLTNKPTIPDAIQTSTMPTASADELGKVYQFVGATDANYTNGYFYKCVSDGQNPATYSWVQTNVQPAPSGLPSQTGNSGKFLTTDGTDASWSDKPLVNTATSPSSLTILGTPVTTSYYSGIINVGVGSQAGNGSAVFGTSARAGDRCLAVGNSASTQGAIGGTAVGNNSFSAGWALALGNGARATAAYSCQICVKLNGDWSNTESGTFKFGNDVANYKILDRDGTIPTDRYTTTPSADGTYVPTLTISSGVATRSWSAPSGGGSTALSLTLASANWSNNSITVTATGVTSSNNVIVSPAPASQSAYTSAGVMCTAQATDSLTFTCTTTPSSDLTVTVLII